MILAVAPGLRCMGRSISIEVYVVKDSRENSKKILVSCPICGFRAELDDFSNDSEVCAQCGRSTYTFRTVRSIRNVFVGELKQKKRD